MALSPFQAGFTFDPAEQVIRGELISGEELLWSGRPVLGLKLRTSDAVVIPFSLMWGGFAIFWEAMVVLGGAPFFFALWGVPFVLIGLYMMFGRFLVDARQRAKTFYGITTERIVIVSGLFARTVKSLSLDTLTDVSLTERRNGGGTITFGPLPAMYWWHPGANWPGNWHHYIPAFELQSDSRRVYEVIHGALRAAKQKFRGDY